MITDNKFFWSVNRGRCEGSFGETTQKKQGPIQVMLLSGREANQTNLEHFTICCFYFYFYFYMAPRKRTETAPTHERKGSTAIENEITRKRMQIDMSVSAGRSSSDDPNLHLYLPHKRTLLSDVFPFCSAHCEAKCGFEKSVVARCIVVSPRTRLRKRSARLIKDNQESEGLSMAEAERFVRSLNDNAMDRGGRAPNENF